MAVEYEISSDVATITGVASNTQVASIVKFYTGSITYDDEPTSKYASVTINGKTQRVMLCVAVSGIVNYDDVPCLYSTVSGHRALNVVEPTESGTPDDVPSLYETVVVNGKTVRALRCVLINQTPNYDGISSTCTFTDNGKTHTAQLVNQVSSSSIETIVKGVSPLSLPDAVANSLQYVKAFGGTEQRDIPDNYLQRQFIYMMDGSYLLTDIVPTYDGRVEIDFQTTRLPSGSAYFLGGRTETYGGLFFAKGGSGTVLIDSFGDRSADRYTSSVSLGNDTRYKFVYDNQVSTLTSGGTTLFTNTSTGTLANGAALCINGLNSSGTVSGAQTGIYLYSFKVWNAQGELVMNLVPAVEKAAVPVVGFYDTVSKTFKTATAGTFAAGGEAVPTPDTPMDIVSNNGVIKVRHQSGLPLGYTLLDSVVFDSTQEIDTGFMPDNNSRIESKCYRTGADCWFYGASPTNPRVTLYHSSTGTCRWGNQSRSNVGFVADTEYTIVEDKNGLNINGVDNPWTSGTAGDFTCDRSLTIGNNNGSTGTRYFAGNFYYMKIYNNGVLARDFVPCQNASNVVGLYDRVNGVFYTDTGLVAGNPVSDPVEVYADGTVETIEDTIGNTATTEMLLKVGDYQDVQSIIDGVVTRNIGIKVLDGTENWAEYGSSIPGLLYSDDVITNNLIGAPITSMICSHLQIDKTTTVEEGRIRFQGNITTNNVTSGRVYIKINSSWTLAQTTQWLADQYAAGTPVIVIYPLATATTESVAGQTLQVQAGDNTLEITQASLSGLELEAEFEKSA